MTEYYKIKTVDDMIATLKKYDGSLPIKKLDLSPSNIAIIKVQDIPVYNVGENGTIDHYEKSVILR